MTRTYALGQGWTATVYDDGSMAIYSPTGGVTTIPKESVDRLRAIFRYVTYGAELDDCLGEDD